MYLTIIMLIFFHLEIVIGLLRLLQIFKCTQTNIITEANPMNADRTASLLIGCIV